MIGPNGYDASKAFVLVAVCLGSIAFAANHKDEYKTATMISWEAGAYCSSISVLHSTNSNCDPTSSVIVYHISADGHEYTLTKNDEHSGILDSKSDPLKKLLPNAQFKYRIDDKGNFWAMWLKNDKPKEAKYSVRGIK